MATGRAPAQWTEVWVKISLEWVQQIETRQAHNASTADKVDIGQENAANQIQKATVVAAVMVVEVEVIKEAMAAEEDMAVVAAMVAATEYKISHKLRSKSSKDKLKDLSFEILDF